MTAFPRGLVRARRLGARVLVFLRKRGWRRTRARLLEEFDDAYSRLRHGRSRYERWFEQQQTQSAALLERVDPDVGPLISVLMPVCDPDPRWLRRAIDSVSTQRHQRWQLCLVDDASADSRVLNLLDEAVASDGRIRLERNARRAGIARTSNRALTMAEGDYVALLDHDDELTPDALMQVAVRAREERFEILYSDEDKFDPRGRLRDPTFKPDRDRDLLRASMYFGHLSVYDAEFLRGLGGFNPELDGSQDYDLALRAEAAAERVVHLPRVLYHWRMAEGSAANPDEDAKPWAYAAGRRALEAALARDPDGACAEDGVGRGHARIVHPLRPGAGLSVLYCECCLSGSLVAQLEAAAQESCDALEIEWVAMSRPGAAGRPGRASRWNEAVARSTAPMLLFLDGVRPSSTSLDWAVEVTAQLQRETVGVIGARIRSDSGALLHAGVVVGGPERFRTQLPGLRSEEPGHLALAQSLRRVTAISGGALGIARERLASLGGFDEDFSLGLHDIDLCLRLQERDVPVIYDPYVELERVDAHFHLSGDAVPASTHKAVEEADRQRLLARWDDVLASPDPHSNVSFHERGAILHPGHRPVESRGD